MKQIYQALVIATLVIGALNGFAQSSAHFITKSTNGFQTPDDLLGMNVSGKDAGFGSASPCNVELTPTKATCNLTPNGSVNVYIGNSTLALPVLYSISGNELSGNTYGPINGSSNSKNFNIDSLYPGTYYINFNGNTNICPYGPGTDSVVVGISTAPLNFSSQITEVGCSGSNEFVFVVGGGQTPITYSYNSYVVLDYGYYDSITGNYSGSSNSDTVQVSNAESNTDYKITGSNAIGCPFTGTVYVIGPQPYGNQSICIVTVDSSTNVNTVIWDQTPSVRTSYYKIYKQNSITSLNDSIGTVNIDSLSVFVDMNSNAAQQSSTYYITVVDSCGNESRLSQAHTTVHLSANQGINNQVNLQWNLYFGFTYSNFEIYRSNNGSAFSLIGTVSNTSTSYTDLTPPSGVNYYYVAVINPAGCNPSRSINASFSNIINNQTLSIANADPVALDVIRGNGAGLFYLNLPSEGNLMVYDNLGQLLSTKKDHQGQNQLDLTQQARGIYFIQFRASDKVYYAKIMNE